MTSGLLRGGGFASTSINKIQSGLPAENLVNGSFSRQIHYVAPEPWTIYAYHSPSGLIRFWVCAGYLWTESYKLAAISSFPKLDALRLGFGYVFQIPPWSAYANSAGRTAFQNANDDREAIQSAQKLIVRLEPEDVPARSRLGECA